MAGWQTHDKTRPRGNWPPNSTVGPNDQRRRGSHVKLKEHSCQVRSPDHPRGGPGRRRIPDPAPGFKPGWGIVNDTNRESGSGDPLREPWWTHSFPAEWGEPVPSSAIAVTLKGEALEEITRTLRVPARSRFVWDLPSLPFDNARNQVLYQLNVYFAVNQDRVTLWAYDFSREVPFYGAGGAPREHFRYFLYENPELSRAMEMLRLPSPSWRWR